MGLVRISRKKTVLSGVASRQGGRIGVQNNKTAAMLVYRKVLCELNFFSCKNFFVLWNLPSCRPREAKLSILGLHLRDKADILVLNRMEFFSKNSRENGVQFSEGRNVFVLVYQNSRRDVKCKPTICQELLLDTLVTWSSFLPVIFIPIGSHSVEHFFLVTVSACYFT